jgi:hypothetical protein
MELAKRMGFYHSCQSVGNMLSGALQAAIMKTLDGNMGLAGWRWYVEETKVSLLDILLTASQALHHQLHYDCRLGYGTSLLFLHLRQTLTAAVLQDSLAFSCFPTTVRLIPSWPNAPKSTY